MAVENKPSGNHPGGLSGSSNTGLTENEDVRRRALMRLGVAGVVTATALAGLWWLDQGSKKPEKPIPKVLPAPIMPAPRQEIAPPEPAPVEPPAAEEPLPAEPEAETAETPPATPAPGKTPAPGTQAAASRPPFPRLPATSSRPADLPPPPPPQVSNTPRLYLPAQPRETPPHAPTQTPAPAPASPPGAQVSGQGERFVVQLGVFSNPERARELVNRLNKLGIRAHLETRVNVGPFTNRQEAERVQVEMRKLGMPAQINPAATMK